MFRRIYARFIDGCWVSGPSSFGVGAVEGICFRTFVGQLMVERLGHIYEIRFRVQHV